MSAPIDASSEWVACPHWHIANPSANINCDSCGATLSPGGLPPNAGDAPTKHWVLFFGIMGLLIGSAIWAGMNPTGIAAKMYGAFLPIVYAATVLYGFGSSFLRFRKRDIDGGILQCALTLLFALAALPTVLDFNR